MLKLASQEKCKSEKTGNFTMALLLFWKVCIRIVLFMFQMVLIHFLVLRQTSFWAYSHSLRTCILLWLLHHLHVDILLSFLGIIGKHKHFRCIVDAAAQNGVLSLKGFLHCFLTKFTVVLAAPSGFLHWATKDPEDPGPRGGSQHIRFLVTGFMYYIGSEGC